MAGVYRKGILSEPHDLDEPAGARRAAFPNDEAVPGLEVEQRGSGRRGVVISVAKGFVTMRDRNGRDSQQRKCAVFEVSPDRREHHNGRRGLQR